MKMLLILSAALLPLGLIAVFASIESAQTARLRQVEDARALSGEAARRLSLIIGRSALDLRAATARLDYAPMSSAELRVRCDVALRDLAAGGRVPVNYAIFTADGRGVCRTPGFAATSVMAPDELFATEVRILPQERRLRFEARSPRGMLFAVGELPVDSIRRVVEARMARLHHDIGLRQGPARMPVIERSLPLRIGRVLTVSSPVAGGQVALDLVANSLPISMIEVLLALLPILMWLAAALIGWLVVDRLLIRPLLQLQQAVHAYRPDGGQLALPTLTTPAYEIRDLAEAFRALTERIGLHDVELAAGMARQTRLTREVHHRVKNNLQVVASLINIHSRGADGPDAAAAYASIQRRVDALSVVHRNHYAELEANRGVGLRPLIGELAANLRSTTPAGVAAMPISIDVRPAFTSQDVAVPVAFLITEIAEVAMSCQPVQPLAIRLEATERADRARLVIVAPALAADRDCPAARLERFRRVVEGLSRQLRAKMALDDQTGTFAIEIMILPDDDPAPAAP